MGRPGRTDRHAATRIDAGTFDSPRDRAGHPLLGLLWVGQGIRIIGGSFMSGDQRWAGIRIAPAALGAYLATTAIRRQG